MKKWCSRGRAVWMGCAKCELEKKEEARFLRQVSVKEGWRGCARLDHSPWVARRKGRERK